MEDDEEDEEEAVAWFASTEVEDGVAKFLFHAARASVILRQFSHIDKLTIDSISGCGEGVCWSWRHCLEDVRPIIAELLMYEGGVLYNFADDQSTRISEKFASAFQIEGLFFVGPAQQRAFIRQRRATYSRSCERGQKLELRESPSECLPTLESNSAFSRLLGFLVPYVPAEPSAF
ncbi:hypothetical protein BD324DRAFT_172112 [Kockovaella imperatae]|uniref:Uncharacterized protein n=1 Tax=Kockovaella imperatae TaxID=4999 RepID=A0A1Y1U9N5_9TREE|nr:hypothetical protein BD324DRAFT_172112 [Kockovaella imperatae]ORX34216.1 hypothetical protein BD324DRAFT_172112 [Kockovaella imperatae]